MSDYNAYGELYDQRPELVIHERLRHNATTIELVEIAKSQNFNVYFDRGPLRQDMMIKWNDTPTSKSESHTVNSCMRYFKRLQEKGY